MDIGVPCLRSRQPRPSHPISPPPITGYMQCSPRGGPGPQGPKGSPLDSQPRSCQQRLAPFLPGSQQAGAA